VSILLGQVQSISLQVTYFTIKICRQLAKLKECVDRLQGDAHRLTEKLIIAFKWLDQKMKKDNVDLIAISEQIGRDRAFLDTNAKFDVSQSSPGQIYVMVFREISKCL